jgi:iron(III) transport system ATP-binding protein
MAELRIANLVKRFGSVTAVDNVSIDVADGEFVTLLGPSGCGKSTTLAAIAGLDRPDEGEIRVGETVYFNGRDGVYLPPEARNCGLVFQSYALWPHMTVYDNVAFPLKLRKVAGAEQQRRVAEVLALVELEPYAKRYPHELSGGQQQRVALARTLVYRPTILLLDEPLSNLDAKLRDRARAWLAELRAQVRLTTIYVTHDQIEALALSDRIVVMNQGRIAQIGTPQEIYERPADAFVADFIGTTNFIAGRVARAAQAGRAEIALADGQRLALSLPRAAAADEPVTLALRPEQMRLLDGAPAPAGGTAVAVQVVSQSYVGGRWQIAFALGDASIRMECERRCADATARLWVPEHGGIVFSGRAQKEA